MTVLRESPWYREIVQEGLQKGLEQGLLEGQREAILHLLQTRFDLSKTAADEVGRQLRAIEDQELLRALVVEAAQAQSLRDFLATLNGQK